MNALIIVDTVMYPDLEAAYQQMAQDEARESLALEWAEATIGDVDNEASGLSWASGVLCSRRRIKIKGRM